MLPSRQPSIRFAFLVLIATRYNPPAAIGSGDSRMRKFRKTYVDKLELSAPPVRLTLTAVKHRFSSSPLRPARHCELPHCKRSHDTALYFKRHVEVGDFIEGNSPRYKRWKSKIHTALAKYMARLETRRRNETQR
jgi:hypothetical protein